MSSHIKVFIRTRPTTQLASDLIQFGQDKQTISVHIPKNEEWGHINNQNENWHFKFDSVMHGMSQKSVYDECAMPVVKSVIEGCNGTISLYKGTILAYGHNGAGKTFSMTGNLDNYNHRGIIPRAISHIFKEIGERQDTSFKVKISFFEIYNEQILDLLSDRTTSDNLTVVEESGGVRVKGLLQNTATSEEEALSYFFQGEKMKSLSQTAKSSSRSHSILTIYIESRSKAETAEKTLVSKLNLVDLAGCERVSKIECSEESLKETMFINRSLAYLEQVILALADKKSHIPYRQSKMTHVLRDSLGENCNTVFIANIQCQKEFVDETISTLRFATSIMAVTVSPEINERYDPEALIKKYEKQIKHLKSELSAREIFANKPHTPSDIYSDSQKADLVKKLKAYIANETEEIELVSMRQIKELLSVFRAMYKNLEPEEKVKSSKADSQSNENKFSSSKSVVSNGKQNEGDTDVAVKAGKKANSSSKQKPFIADAVDTLEKQEEVISEPPLPNTNVEQMARIPLTRADEFENFKKGKGIDLSKTLWDSKETLKLKNRKAKALAESINAIKIKIDVLKAKVGKQKLEREKDKSSQVIIEETDYQDIKTLKQFKEEYNKLIDEFEIIKRDIQGCQKDTNLARQNLLAEFEVWYESSSSSAADLRAQGDVLDVREKFELLEMQRLSADPESLPFFTAKKKSDSVLKKLLTASRKVTTL